MASKKLKKYFVPQEYNKLNQAPPQALGADHWDSELEIVDHCSKAPENVKVWIKPLSKVKIDALMEKYPNIEWFAYLLGDGEDKFTVCDIHVPTQTVTPASVDQIECPEFNELPIIGAIHSHHGMGTGFSSTDHAFVNQNHNISLVISKTSIAGQVRWRTACGCLKILEAIVKPKIEVDFDKEFFLSDTVQKINKRLPVVTARFVNGHAPIGTPGVGPGTWVNGDWVPAQRTASQRSYTNGVSVKQLVEEKTKEINQGVSTDDGSDAWESEQTLMEALDEAFPNDE